MTDPRDRLLEGALERVMRKEPDLTRRIVSAWERGEEPRNFDAAESAREAPRPRPVTGAPTRWWGIPATAAAAIAAFFGVRELLEQSSSVDPGSASRSETVAVATEGRGSDGPAALARSTPLDGEEPQSPEHQSPERQSPDFGPTPGGVDPLLANAGEPARGPELGGRGAGGAELVAAGPADTAPQASDDPALPTTQTATLTIEERKSLEQLYLVVSRGEEAPTVQAGIEYGMPLPPFDKLAAFGRRSSTHWGVVADRVRSEFEGQRRWTVARARLLAYLGYDESDDALKLARELWLRSPESFEDANVVAFAERGAFEFEREIFALVADYEAAGREAPVLPAAYLGLRGWEEGRDVLAEAVATTEFETQRYPRLLAGAAALENLGDSGSWPRLMASLEAAVESALENDKLDEAAWLVLATEDFRQLMAESSAPSIALLDWRAMAHYIERREAIPDDAALRALLTEVASW